jgi:gamma-glutamyltranspeptidase/glutathione hydrolase
MTRPIQDLVNYEEMVAKKISKDKAERIAQVLKDEGTDETTHFSVVDRDGMAVGVTQSLNSYFGSKVTHPTLGFFIQRLYV